MKRFQTIQMICLIIMCFVSTSLAADVIKIGVVDFQKILEESKVGKSAQSEIKTQGEKMEKDLKEKGEEIEKLKEKLERDALVIDRDARGDRERELRIKINDLKVLQKKYMADFRDIEARMIERIRKELIEIVEQFGKDEGYTIIMEKRESGVLYSPSKIDLTEKITRLYNQKFRQ